MKSPYFAEEHGLLRDQIQRFIAEYILHDALEWEEAGCVPRDVLRKMGDLGFFGLRYPVRFGGSEMDQLATVVLAEELGRSTFGGFAITVLVHTDMASPHLANAGNDQQLERYMPGIVSGELLTAVAVTEPDAGSDVAAIKTRAKRDGDSWVLNGAKTFITNGHQADIYFVAARTGSQADGHRGISMFVLHKGTPGFSIGRRIDKMGWRCSDTAELFFDDCRVPGNNLLGAENRGFYSIMRNFENERLAMAAQAVGEASRAIELTIGYASDRKAFGKSLWEQPVIRQRLSMLRARVEAARHFVYNTAWRAAQGEEVTAEVSMLKALCGELVNEVMYHCLQFHGGFGFTKDSTIERMARDARVQAIGGGATEVMLEQVARRSDHLTN